MAYKEVEVGKATVVDFKDENKKYVEGMEFEGIFLGVKDFINKRNGKPGRYFRFSDVDDEDVNYIVYDSAALGNKMEKVKYEQKVKIVFLGFKKSVKDPTTEYKDFAVYRDE